MFSFDLKDLPGKEEPVEKDQDTGDHAAERRHHLPGQSDVKQAFGDDRAQSVTKGRDQTQDIPFFTLFYSGRHRCFPPRRSKDLLQAYYKPHR